MNKKPSDSNKAKKGSFKAFLKSRKAKRGALSILLTVLFIAAIVLVNIITNVLTDRFPALSMDLTGNSVYQLQEESKEYAEDLDKEVTIYILQEEADFESNDEYYVQANRLIRQLEQASPNISVKYINLTSNPSFTTKYPNIDWTKSHLILVESGDDYRVIDAEDMFEYDQESYYYYGTYQITSQHIEQAVITAILNVTTEEKVKVTVLSGQGEQDCSAFTTLLENNAYEIEEVSLLTGAISDDSQFVIIYCPSTDIDNSVYTTITDWLYNNGQYGHTLVYLPNDQVDQTEFKNLNNLLEDWGMEVEDGWVYETDINHMTTYQYPNFVSIFDYDSEDYTEGLKNPSIPVVMYYTLPVRISASADAVSLLASSDSAVVLPRDASDDWDANDQTQEKLTGAAISTRSSEEGDSSNLLVIGSYDAWATGALSTHSFNNAEYFVNLFNTIAQRDEIGITIEGKSLENDELSINNQGISTFLSILFRYVIPIGILIVGFVVWIRRRNK
ncbi:MAG: Gldg family protein [Ruminococcus sp.]|nr:Gldg family protein [Ruminococcus sp.]